MFENFSPSRRFIRKSLWWLFFLNFLLRLPGLYKEFPPYAPCDEDEIIENVYQMFSNGDLTIRLFLSGGINFHIPINAVKLTRVFNDNELRLKDLRMRTRVVSVGILSSATVWWLFPAALALSGSPLVAYASTILYTISPMMLGTSRFHYPDHYIVFFSAAVLFFLAKILTATNSRRKWIYYIFAGVFAGLTASVKYTGFLLCLLIALVYLLEQTRNRSSLKTLALNLYLGILAALAAAGIFAWVNASVFTNWQAFQDALAVPHYKPAADFFTGRIFYSEVVLFSSLGLLGGLLYGFGFWHLLKNNWRALLTLISIPILLIFIVGRYQLLFTRNMMLVMPFMFVLAGYGSVAFWTFIKQRVPLPRRHHALVSLVALFLIEPTFKSLYAFARDFQDDTRIKAKTWLAEEQAAGNIAADANIFSNGGCTYAGATKAHNPDPPGKCFDYVMLDTWMGGIRPNGSGRENSLHLWWMLMELDHKALHFMNDMQVWHNQGPAKDMLKDHKLVKVIRGFGPNVFVFKSEKSCAL